MKFPVSVALPVPPSTNRYWTPLQVRDKKTGKMRSINVPSAAAKKYKADVRWRLQLEGVHTPTPILLSLEVVYFPHRPLDWQRRAKKDPQEWERTVQALDVDNVLKCLLDTLQGMVVIDDRQFFDVRVRRGTPQPQEQVYLTFSEWGRQTGAALGKTCDLNLGMRDEPFG